jgi:hypothetical protein
MISIARPFLCGEEAAAREVILSGWLTQGLKVKNLRRRLLSLCLWDDRWRV